ncbi:MAG: hypothetical protein ACWGQW_19455 [bacterium]
MVFQAALQGVDLREKLGIETDETPKKTDFMDGSPIFKDPEAYKDMTDEEKEAETKRMTRFLKGMVHDPKDKLKAPRKYLSGMRM